VAGRMAATPEYEAAPVLLRHALLGDEACMKAVGALDMPQGAWAILYNCDRGELMTALPALLRMKGEELPGADLAAWERLVRERGLGGRGAMPASVSADADSVVRAFAKYVDTSAMVMDRYRVKPQEMMFDDVRMRFTNGAGRFYAECRERANGYAKLNGVTVGEKPGDFARDVERYVREAERILVRPLGER
jgi:hypothetical protein